MQQLRQRQASVLTQYFKSFLREFGKKKWTLNQQSIIVKDFLDFMSSKIAECSIWEGASEEELKNAREGMEKLVMIKLFPL